jgi:hypothetical protein
VELVSRLGYPTDYAEHRFDLVYPRLSTAPDPDVAEGILGRLSAEQLGLAPTSARRFTPAQRARLEVIVEDLRRDGALVESQVRDRFAALCLAVADGAAGRVVVILEPARPGTPCFVAAGGGAVRYNGQMTRALSERLERISRLLESPDRPAAAGPRPGRPRGRRRPERS